VLLPRLPAGFPHFACQVPSAKPPSTQPTSSRQDPFYGHEQASKLWTRFITHLFRCPEYPPSSSNSTVKLTTPFHSVRLAQDEAPCLSHLCRSRPLTAAQGSFSDRLGIFGSSAVCIGLHACLQGHLRQHLLQQIAVHRRSRDVPASGDQPDGKGEVSVP
jgi:hypothetical protein